MQDALPSTGRKMKLTANCVLYHRKELKILKPINPKPQPSPFKCNFLYMYPVNPNVKINPDCLSRSISYGILSLAIQHFIRMCLKVIYNLLDSLDLKLTLIIRNTRQDLSSQCYLQLLQRQNYKYLLHRDKVVTSLNCRIQIRLKLINQITD